jgi:PAS domain S-box-containing protein
MQLTHKRKVQLPAVAVQLLLGIAGLALITFICFQLGFHIGRTAFAYLILIALVSLLGNFSASVALSIIAVACLNYFFASPLFDLRIDDPEDIERIAAFLTTSLVVTALTNRRKHVEEELRESRNRLEDAQRLAHVGWWQRDLMTDRVTVSDEVSRILGVRPVARWLNLIHPEDRQRAADAAEAALRPGGARYDVEYRVMRPDGALRVVHSEADVTRHDSGQPLRQFGVLQDVTELRQAEEELRASEARFRTFVDHATDAFFLLDDDSTILDLNRQACDSLGYSKEELIGKHRSDFDVGLDDTSIKRLKQRVVTGEAITFETRHRRKDGTTFPVEIRVGQFEQDGRRFLCLARDITQRKRAEDELRASEERFRSFVDHATDGFFLLDEHQAILDVNRQACESLGYSREEMIGMRPRDFDAGLDAESFARIGERVTSGETVTFETLHRRKDGTVFPVEVRARQFQLGADRFRLSLARDITERKRAEEALRESEAKLQKAQGVAHFGWWERDFTTKHVSLSDEVCRIFGLEPVDLPEWHERWVQLIHPEDRPRAAGAAAAALIPGGPRYDVEYRVVRPDGSERMIHSQGDVTWDAAGRPLRQFGVLQDITELRQAEKELRASEMRFRTFVDHATDAFLLLDEDWTVLDVNRQACDGLGYSREALIGKHKSDLDVGLDDSSIQRLKQRMIAGEAITFETRHRRKDGSSFPVEVRVGRFEQDGQRFLCSVRDITERKRAEEALRRSEAYLAEAQRLSHTGTLAFNATAPVYWSEESYRIWGLDPQQGLPDRETVVQRIHPDDRERVNAEVDEALHQKRDFALEFRIMLPDGTVKYIESTGHPLVSSDGEVVEMIATHVDVTERKRAQVEHERLRQLEADLAHLNRVSMMGELAASLAHEILHPIATARNNARAGMRFLERSPPDLGEVKEALACIVRDSDRAKDIVGRMRDHIKKAPPRREPFDLNEAINEVIVTARSTIGNNKVLVRTSLMELPPVVGDRVQLQQVVMNLILNAVEAMSAVDEGARELSIGSESEQHETGGVLVTVRDSGPGIDAGQLDRVFEPFYTTKTSGMGMGLSICRSIVAAHGGRLWAEANRPQGTIFQFTLPAGLEDLPAP